MTKTQESSHTRESRGQPIYIFPAGEHKTAVNRHYSMTDMESKTQKDPQKKQRLGAVNKNLLKGLNMSNGTNLTLSSDVDQITYGKVTQTHDAQQDSQEVSPFQADGHKATVIRQDSITKTNMKPK